MGCRGPTWLCLVSGDAAVPESAITEKKPSGYEPTLPGVRGGADVGGGGRDLRKKNQRPLQRRDPAFHSTPRPSSPPLRRTPAPPTAAGPHLPDSPLLVGGSRRGC